MTTQETRFTLPTTVWATQGPLRLGRRKVTVHAVVGVAGACRQETRMQPDRYSKEAVLAHARLVMCGLCVQRLGEVPTLRLLAEETALLERRAELLPAARMYRAAVARGIDEQGGALYRAAAEFGAITGRLVQIRAQLPRR